MIRSLFSGLILNIQFFSSIPLGNIEIPITRLHVRRAVQLFPLLGMIQGFCFAFLLYVLLTWTFFSPLAIALMLAIFIIYITGGIHLDGWIDSSDAFFSYRDVKKRIDILADPRVGAFGVISAIVLLVVRFIFIYETVQMVHGATYMMIFLIPFLGKIVMGLTLTAIHPAKQTGLGQLFHEATGKSVYICYVVFIITTFIILALYRPNMLIMIAIMLIVAMIAFIFIVIKVKKWFGGMTGDVVGAATEGVETVLWLTIWLYHYSVMGLL